MRRLILAIAAIAGVLLQTGVAVAAPVLHLSGWKATAGKPETFTITRVGGNGAATVVFKTSDGSASAGPDYAATSLTISWQPRQTTATVQVATFVNPAKAGQNISFTASITVNGATSAATGLIVEPVAPPAPLPTPSPSAWVPAPLTAGGYARCATVGGCHSIGAPYPPIIAQPGDVLLQKWNGISVDDRQVIALYPIGQWMVAGVGLEAYQDEWEGVAPAP